MMRNEDGLESRIAEIRAQHRPVEGDPTFCACGDELFGCDKAYLLDFLDQVVQVLASAITPAEAYADEYGAYGADLDGARAILATPDARAILEGER